MKTIQSSPQAGGHYINREWRSSLGPPLQSINPATGDVIWHSYEATQTEVDLAYAGAKDALPQWGALSYHKRAAYLQQFAQRIQDRMPELAHTIALETGKPLWESATEVTSVINKIAISIEAYEARCRETPISQPDQAIGITRYKPLGIVVVLGPFNFPAHLSNGHIVPALLAGNTILYKPSELCPAVAELIMQCWHEAELPAGVLQCLQGGPQVAQWLFEQNINAVFFTGSYQTGVLINQQFSRRPSVLLALEMGGNNPLIIDQVKDRRAAVYQTIVSSLITAGQRCSCARRLFIPNNNDGELFIRDFRTACQTLKIGPFNQTPEPFMGPVIRYQHALQHLSKQDALLQAGGIALLKMELRQENTGFLSPGIIDMTSVATPDDIEIFAPLVQLYRYDDFEHAITMANQTEYGLSAALFSDDVHKYHYFYHHINAGVINWNRPTTGASSMLPFGGIGKSGNHRPSAYFATDYSSYPIACMEGGELTFPQKQLPGIPTF